jgi:hypothetical protein
MTLQTPIPHRELAHCALTASQMATSLQASEPSIGGLTLRPLLLRLAMPGALEIQRRSF